MPIDHRIDRERRRAVATVTGTVSFDEILAAMDAILLDPEFEAGFDLYSDHTGIERIITTPEVRGVVEHLVSRRDRLAGSRWAVVTKQPASYGMMRMLSVYAEQVPLEMQVFQSHDEAEAWLAERRE